MRTMARGYRSIYQRPRWYESVLRAPLAHGSRRLPARQRAVRHVAAPLGHQPGHQPAHAAHHFESKEQLVAEALAASRERQRRATLAWVQQQPELAPAQLLRRFWAWQLDGHQPFLRLFFEVYGLALQDENHFPGFLERAVADWLEFIGALLIRAGLTPAQARIAATVVIAGYRGLLLDFLATGDRRRTTRALDLLLAALEDSYEPES
jgi:AcrR family transcriptional regulator